MLSSVKRVSTRLSGGSCRGLEHRLSAICVCIHRESLGNEWFPDDKFRQHRCFIRQSLNYTLLRRSNYVG
jgi:hypothetical protein